MPAGCSGTTGQTHACQIRQAQGGEGPCAWGEGAESQVPGKQGHQCEGKQQQWAACSEQQQWRCSAL